MQKSFEVEIAKVEEYYEIDHNFNNKNIEQELKNFHDTFLKYSMYNHETEKLEENHRDFDFGFTCIIKTALLFDKDGYKNIPQLRNLVGGDLGIRLYGVMVNNISRFYYILRSNRELYSLQFERISTIIKAFYFLEEGIVDFLGFKLKRMKRTDSDEVQQEKLAKLDTGRVVFKRYLTWLFNNHMKNFVDRNLIIAFARKIYYNVHCFQAPPRVDPFQAELDASGQSDHFSELVDEIQVDLEK